MPRILLLFPNTREVIKAERTLNQSHICNKVITVPRHISAECGMALEVAVNDADSVAETFDAENIRYTSHTEL